MDLNEKYMPVVETIQKAGGTPPPTTPTLVELIKEVIKEDEIDFILAFNEQKSQTMEQLKASTGLSEDEINAKVEVLAKRGVIFNQPNSKGMMVFRLLPLFNVGIFEYMFMKKLEITPETQRIAALFTKMFDEHRGLVKEHYEDVVKMVKNIPPIDRTVPYTTNQDSGQSISIEINQSLGEMEEVHMPFQDVKDIVAKFDDIAVGHCFCRHHKDVVGDPCKQTDSRENCFTFGKSARYTSAQGFSRMVTKEEALAILTKAEDDGLIHKAYHPGFNSSRDETSICSCCSCCCGNAHGMTIAGTANEAWFMAVVDTGKCVSCGTCAEKCGTQAMTQGEDGSPSLNKDLCIGCGVCAHFCPENAISLVQNRRIVYTTPPRPE
ncbi:ATP-binding protein [Desulfatibacillum aliphaticivorans]|uniref:ATP-binding protein n=1 Tax=Desulfatibacillum aliphaticivorans TaxID=218208 RepID=UPI00040A9C0B|nr:4Fe-4S binding protein [Desulfatibacillum aliphaticivorans]